jgi:hypothetical protein
MDRAQKPSDCKLDSVPGFWGSVEEGMATGVETDGSWLFYDIFLVFFKR